MRGLVKAFLQSRGIIGSANQEHGYAAPGSLAKAKTNIERYGEIISDPLNLLISRVQDAGYVDERGHVILHNGLRVPVFGDFAYYSEFSDILVINRGVHEPLEEFCFQQMLSRTMFNAPTMIELGSYWAHYSMWLKNSHHEARCIMVEPDKHNLKCGMNNFVLNGFEGEFICDQVGAAAFCIDSFASQRGISTFDILHSDIQGNEVEMLQGAREVFAAKKVKYAYISTHSEALHSEVVRQLTDYSYRIEVSSGFDCHTTSHDGFVFASSSDVDPIFNGFSPLGRIDIARSTPMQLAKYVNSVAEQLPC